ncbi:MAG: hypothetical protein LBM04_12880, partial [Opitutaceae bacterium]|nr:hypothetical protein [Opitutaceae bacterium]
CGDAISALSRSVNHRLISGKPPACPGATAKKQGILPTDIFKRMYANYHALWDTSRVGAARLKKGLKG